ncbi:MAG: cytidine deaminase [Chloroflexi bacterium OLB15]|nr:MAG: cytidine deaminase [Chloroflexi bacterium OLB15]
MTTSKPFGRVKNYLQQPKMSPSSDSELSRLIEAAIRVTENAYIPYSHYPVGAALQAADGRVFTGCNVENASYPATICAERTALVKAVSEGARQFTTLVVATRDGGSPCGICRQMLSEFGVDVRVVLITLEGRIIHDTTLAALLPLNFTNDSLNLPDNGTR